MLLSQEMLFGCHQLSHTEVIQTQDGQNEPPTLLLHKAHLEEDSH